MGRQVQTVIIGAGFGGIAAAHALRERGQQDFVILERGDRPGGVWRANRYPGVACDVASNLYSFSFAPNPGWSRRFSPGSEIQRYLCDVMRRFDLERHLRVDAEVSRATFDERAGRWRVELEGGDVLDAEVLITACGQLTRPVVPNLPGLDAFGGRWFHSAEWPEQLRVEGQRVAAIGTGASAIQFVPAIAPIAESVTIFQRSAPWVLPKPDAAYGRVTHWLCQHVPGVQRLARWLWQVQFEGLGPIFTRQPPLRARLIEAVFRRLLWLYRFVQLRGERSLMTATTPETPLGCKRVLLTSDWYPALRRGNVALSSSPIREVTNAGVVTEDGTHHDADILVFGTGFASTEFLAPMDVTGRDGWSIHDAWRDGAEAFLGITVHGFPNLFMLYGPNTNHGTGSIVDALEAQAEYVGQAVELLATDCAAQLEVRRDVQQSFNEELEERLRGTAWAGCTSWYVNDKGRITNNWPGSHDEYRQRTKKPDLAHYRTEAGPILLADRAPDLKEITPKGH